MERRKVDYLRPIPPECDIVYASSFLGDERTVGGFPPNELFAMDSRTGSTTRLTLGRHWHNHFAASPGGRMIAVNKVLEDTNGNGQLEISDRKSLWVLDLEAGEEWTLVPDLDAGWGGIDWSLDGQWLVLSMGDVRGPRSGVDIYRVHPDGTGLENLTVGIESELGPPGATGKFVSDVGVSHDGESVVFLYHPRMPEEGPPKAKVAISRVDRSAAWMVTDGGPLPPGRRGAWSTGDYDPEFSPDGQYICFARCTDVAMNGSLSSHDVMRCRIDGSDPRWVTPADHPSGKGIADWSEDDRIVCMEVDAQTGYMGPLIVNADGSDLRRYPEVRGTHFRWIPGRTSRG